MNKEKSLYLASTGNSKSRWDIFSTIECSLINCSILTVGRPQILWNSAKIYRTALWLFHFQQWYRDILKVWKNVSRLSKNAPKQLSIRRSVKDEIKNNEKVAMAHYKISNKKITSLDIWSHELPLVWGLYCTRVWKNKSFNQNFVLKQNA